MSNLFKRAVKEESKLRLCVAGPSGSGKTYTSLTFAQELAKGKPFAVIDTENGSAAKYADQFTFDVLNVEAPFRIEKAVEYLEAAEEAGYEVVVLDSATHFYKGSGGLLEHVSDVANAKYRGNSYAAWNEGGKLYNNFLEAIKQSNLHVIVTARTKTKYVEGERRGQMMKVGMEVEMRDGFEYEFDLFAQMNIEDNAAHFEKSRCSRLQGEVYKRPGKEVVEILDAWLQAARVVDGETVHDKLMDYSDGVVKFVRVMRSDLGREGTEQLSRNAWDLIAGILDVDESVAHDVAYWITDSAEWDTATMEKLETFIEKHEGLLKERLQEIAAKLPESKGA